MYRYYVKDHGKKRMIEYPKKEVLQLAELIGIDFESETQYRWFLHQALASLLPIGWKRESDPLGNIQYHNVKTQVTTKNNPLVYKFRKCFERLVLKDLEAAFANASKGTEARNSNDGQKIGNMQDIAISSYEEQQQVFKKLMLKVSKSGANYSDQPQQVMKEAEEFYEMIFIDNSFSPPKSIEESLEYQLVVPDEMLDFARDYGFSHEYSLLWIARVALVLPLPPFWREEVDALGNKVFINSELNYSQPHPPYHSFLVKFIQKAKQAIDRTADKFMTFYNKESIRYVVDLMKLTSRKDFIVLQDSIPDPEFRKKALYFKPHLTSEEALTDIMIFEISQSIGIDLNKDIQLISAVYQIIESLKSDNILKNWDFRITMEGNRYWYNSKEKRSEKSFPYKEEIKKYVRIVRKEAFSNAKHSIRSFAERHPEYKEKGKAFYDRCRKEASTLFEIFIRKALGATSAQVPEVYQIPADLKDSLKKGESFADILDLYYACPFTFGVTIPEDPSTDPQEFNIDMPQEKAEDWLSSKKIQKMNEEQIENFLKQKIEKTEPHEKEFVRNDRDRRRTIAIESIQVDTTKIRRIKTLHREEDGIIEETDSSKEDSSKHEEPPAESEEENYEELQNIIDDENKTHSYKRISTMRLAVSRKNTIESILLQERRKTLPGAEKDYQRSSSQQLKDCEPPKFERRSISPEVKQTNDEELIKIVEPEIQNSKEIYELEQIPSDRQGEESGNIEEIIVDEKIIGINDEKYREEQRIAAADIQIDRQASLKRIDTKKSVNFKLEDNENLEDNMDFSSIISQCDESISDDSLVNMEIEKKLNAESSDLSSMPSQSNRMKIVSKKSIKSTGKNEDSMSSLSFSSNLQGFVENASSNPVVPMQSSNNSKAKSNWNSLRNSLKPSNSIKLLKEGEKSPKNVKPNTNLSDSHTNSPEKQQPTSILKNSSIKKADSTLNPSKSSIPEPNKPDSEQTPREDPFKRPAQRHLSIKTLAAPSPKQELHPAASNQTLDPEPEAVKSPPPFQQPSIDTFEMRRKIFQDIFDPEKLKKAFPASRIQNSPTAENLEVFGAHIYRMPRSTDPIESPKTLIKTKLEPLEDNPVLKRNTESLSVLPRANKNLLAPPKRQRAPIDNSTIAVQEKLLFMYYLETIGHPGSPKSSLNFYYVQRYVQPNDVIAMNKRLGVKVGPTPFASLESDLAWIGYLQIAAPMPSGFNKHTKISTLLEWELGKHPGDVYFKLLYNFQKKFRLKELKKLNKNAKVDNLISHSWSKFINDKNKVFYYNYLTCERRENSPIIADNYDLSIGVKKKNKLKEMLTQDIDIQEIMFKYDIEENFKEDKHFSLSNWIIQTLMNNEDITESLRSSAGSSRIM